MKIIIAVIGKAKASPEQALYAEYIRRLPWQVSLKELEEKRNLSSDQRKEREGELLLDATRGVDRLVALDERGKNYSSQQFAAEIARWHDQSLSSFGFIIGGSDGLSDAVRQSAHLLLSFGTMTWPHLLVRTMLAEQLYRAHTISTGHPYHRA